jgi:hypothetical protein
MMQFWMFISDFSCGSAVGLPEGGCPGSEDAGDGAPELDSDDEACAACALPPGVCSSALPDGDDADGDSGFAGGELFAIG